QRKLGHRLEHDRLAVRRDAVDERRARLAHAPVDDHRARAADLLEAARLPHDRRDLLARRRGRVFLHLHQRAGDVHLRLPRDDELLPTARRARVVLTLDLEAYGALHPSLRQVLAFATGRGFWEGRASPLVAELAAPACSYLRGRGLTSEMSTSSL